MTTAAIPSLLRKRDDIVTLADLRDRFDVPPERVWTIPLPGTATEQDMIYAEEHLDRLCELIDGTLVEKAMGSRESLIGVAIASVLRAFILLQKLGFVVGTDSMFRLFPGQVRMPDVAFVSLQRLPRGFPKEPVVAIAPELAVEVLSASDTFREMKRKRREYFIAGVRLVWIVDPNTRTVAVYTEPEVFISKGQEDLLDGGSVLPGFSVRVGDLFAELDLRADS